MQLYKHNTSRDGTHKQAGGWSVDAALFAEELVEKAILLLLLRVGAKQKSKDWFWLICG